MTSRFVGQYNRIKNFRQRTKEKAVNYLGGKCKICGYSKCIRALSFHHLDKSTKEFAISANCNKAWDKVQTELDKCVLLCANCHMEVEAGISFV